MDRKKTVEQCFNAIMNLYGADEFKTTVRRLHTFLKNKEAYSLTDLSLPNYLWSAKRGGGVSTLVKAFAEYLYAAKAIDFCGTVKYFEFKLEYIAPEFFFSELARLDHTVSSLAGHNRYYKGLICINIDDEWLKFPERINEEHYAKLLKYISDNKERMPAIFSVNTDDRDVIESVESVLSSYMRIESVSLRFPEIKELIEFMESRYMHDKGLSLSKSAKALLSKSITEIVLGKNFNGFKSVAQLADDILYNIFAANLTGKKYITADMLSCYDKESNYVKRTKHCINTQKTIGFSGRDI